MIASLPSALHGWINLFISHWMMVNKWVGVNGHILASHVRGHTGIPQSDAASPTVLSFFLWEGFEAVQAELCQLGGQFFGSLLYG